MQSFLLKKLYIRVDSTGRDTQLRMRAAAGTSAIAFASLGSHTRKSAPAFPLRRQTWGTQSANRIVNRKNPTRYMEAAK
jgi:hypothetical protein